METSLYSKEECDVIYDYLLEKNWISESDGPEGVEAKKQLVYLSAFNPAYFEQICSMTRNLKFVVPFVPL